MPYLPYTFELGHLEIVETYVYYDGPRLLACRNRTGQLYLALWAGETRGAESWILAPLSERRFQVVRSGGVDLRDAFLQAEESRAYSLHCPADYENAEVRALSAEGLDAAILPLPDERLDLETVTLPALSKPDAAAEARYLRREVLDLNLQLPGERRSEAPADFLGTVLSQVQKVLDAIAQARFGQVTRRAPIPQEMRQLSKVSVVGTYGGSFGVRLAARGAVDLFNYSQAGDVISEFLTLLAAGNDQDALSEILGRLEARVAARYRVFLEALSTQDTAASFVWGSPGRAAVRQEQLAAETIRAAVLTVNAIEQQRPVEYEMRCVLIGINVRTKSYEIWDVEGEKKYSGRVLDDAMPQVEHATVNEEYVALIQEIIEVHPTTGEEKIKWRLVGLQPVQQGPETDDHTESQ